VSRFAQSASTPWRRVGEDVILAPQGRDDFDHLSGTAAVVWSFLDTPQTVDSLVEELAELFAVPAEGISGDVETLVADLTRRGVIEEVP
jgi:hypothetical protein